LNQKVFKKISKETLITLLKEDNFAINEVDLFQFVVNQSKKEIKSENPEELRKHLSAFLPHIRFPIMSSQDIATKVVPTRILSCDETLALYGYVGTYQAKEKEHKERKGTEKFVPPSLPKALEQFNATKRKPPGVNLTFVSKSSGIEISQDGKTAMHQNGSMSHEFVFCQESFSTGVHEWKFRIESMTNDQWIFFGVNRLEPHEHASYNRNHQGAFGLSSGSYNFINGSMISVTLGVQRCFRTGDVIHVILDCDNHVLTLREPTRNFVHVIPELTPGVAWHPMVNLYGSGDSVTLNI